MTIGKLMQIVDDCATAEVTFKGVTATPSMDRVTLVTWDISTYSRLIDNIPKHYVEFHNSFYNQYAHANEYYINVKIDKARLS